jgi:hypothetical protein
VRYFAREGAFRAVQECDKAEMLGRTLQVMMAMMMMMMMTMMMMLMLGRTLQVSPSADNDRLFIANLPNQMSEQEVRGGGRGLGG